MNDPIAVGEDDGDDPNAGGDVAALAHRRAELEGTGAEPAALAAATLAWARAADAADHPDAVAALSLALTRATRPAIRARLCEALARRALDEGDVERALRTLDEAEAPPGDDRAQATSIHAWLELAARAAEVGRADVAADAGAHALAALPGADPRRNLVHRAMASAFGTLGRVGDALRHVEAALEDADADAIADLHEVAAALLDAAERAGEALDWREAAVDRLAPGGPSQALARAWFALAAAQARQRQPAAVREATREAMVCLTHLGDPAGLAVGHEEAADLLDLTGQHDLAQDHVAWAAALRLGHEAPPWTSMQAAAATVVRPRNPGEADAALRYLEAFATRSRDDAMRDATLRMLVDALPWSAPGAVARALGVLVGAGAPPWPHNVVRAQLTTVLKAALPFAEALHRLSGGAHQAPPALWALAARAQPAGEAAMHAVAPCADGLADMLAVTGEARQAARADATFMEALKLARARIPAVGGVARLLDAVDREDIVVLDATHGASWRVRCSGVLHVAQLLALFDTLGGEEPIVVAEESVREVARGRGLWLPGLTFATSWSTWSWPALRDGLEVGGDPPAPDRHRLDPAERLRDLPRLAGRAMLVLVQETDESAFDLPETAPIRARIDRADPHSAVEHLTLVERIEAARTTLDFRRHDERALMQAATGAQERGDLETALGIAQWLLVRLDVPGASMEPVAPLRLLIQGHAAIDEWPEAADAAQLLVTWLDRSGDQRGAERIEALLDLGATTERAGDRAAATAAFERAQRLAVRHPGPGYAGLIQCHRRMADWFAETSRVQTAIGHLEQAASLLSAGSDPALLAETLRALAALQARHHAAPETALNTMLYAAEARRQSVGDRHPDVAADLRDLAILLDQSGRHGEATAARQEARELLAEVWYTPDDVGLDAMLADLDAHDAQGEVEEGSWLAERAWRTAAALWGPTDRRSLAQAARAAALLREAGRDDQAADLSQHVRRAAQGSADPLVLAEALCCQAEALAATGAVESAREALDRCTAITSRHDEPALRGRCLIVAARLHAVVGDLVVAEHQLRQAAPFVAHRPDLQRHVERALEALHAPAPPERDAWDEDETPTEA